MQDPLIFREGCKILLHVLQPCGFSFVEGSSGSSSGGHFASGNFVKNDRALELHFRSSLGLVTYHIGTLSIRHDTYMRLMLGPHGDNKYPGFSADPLHAFRALASDLQRFCSDFLNGSGDRFAAYVEAAKQYEKLSGIAKLAPHES
jgi:hypothetical protein